MMDRTEAGDLMRLLRAAGHKASIWHSKFPTGFTPSWEAWQVVVLGKPNQFFQGEFAVKAFIQERAAEETTKLWLTCDDDEPSGTTLAQFCRDNVDAPEVCELARALWPGQSVRHGGGAAPIFTIERLFDDLPQEVPSCP